MVENIIIYKTKDNKIDLTVQLEKDTVWLSQDQMSFLFNKAKSTINEHVKNIFKEGELNKDDVIRKFGNSEYSTKPTNFYNLDVIISVGYRVKSLEGTQFRIWATNVLRKYLVDGYAINQKRLEESAEKYAQLQTQLKTLRKVIENETFTLNQSKALMKIITDYAASLELLDKFDHDTIENPRNVTTESAQQVEYVHAKEEINSLREQLSAGELFGNEKGNGFKSALKTIFQTFDGIDLYPSIEEKSANLLYLIIKTIRLAMGINVSVHLCLLDF